MVRRMLRGLLGLWLLTVIARYAFATRSGGSQ